MKKRILAILAATTLVASMIAGCGNKETSNEVKDSEAIEESTEEVEVTELSNDEYGLKLDGEFGDAASVDVQDIAEGTEDYTNVQGKLDPNGLIAFCVYDINLLDAKASNVQPEGKVNITMNIPSNLASTQGDTYKVFRMEDNGELEALNTSVSNDKVTFETEHFSIYVIAKYGTVEETTEVPENTETEVTDTNQNPLAGYTFTDMDKTMYATQTVNTRKGPSTDFDKIGSFSPNEAVRVVGQCNETGWYKVEVDRNTYEYVSNKYLSESKVETTASNTTTDSTTTPTDNGVSTGGTPAETPEQSSTDVPTQVNETCPYTMYQITTYNGHIGYFSDGSDSQADTDTASNLQFYLAEQGVILPSTITWGHENLGWYGERVVVFKYIIY